MWRDLFSKRSPWAMRIAACRAMQIALSGCLAMAVMVSSVRADDATVEPKKSLDVVKRAAKPQLKPAEAAARADALVNEALHREIYSDMAQRDRLLAEAKEIAPNHAAAHWHTGHVLHKGRWAKADDVIELASTDNNLSRYVSKRESSPDTAQGHLELARWCEARGLKEQARAHYANVIDFQPDHAEARTKLGFRRMNNIWVTDAEIQAVEAEAKQLAKAVEQYLPAAYRIRDGLLSNNDKQRAAAEEELAKIEDSAAIPVLERVLSAAGEEIATKLVEKIAEWKGEAVSRSLSRQAVYSPYDNVRHLAAEKLRGRSQEEFVPALLDLLRTNVQVRTAFVRVGGQIVMREFFLREGPNAWELMTLDTVYVRNALPNGDGADTLSRAVLDMRRTVAMRQAAVGQQNQQQSELNQRITDCLAVATETSTNVSSEDWWNWWNQQNELGEAPKPVTGGYERSTRVFNDQRVFESQRKGSEGARNGNDTPRPMRARAETPGAIFPTRGDCFAAGTPVWTITGMQPIEKLRVGDLVLSQDIETGELAFKPVLRRTVRPPEPVFDVIVDDETIRSSGGHLLWVAGEGWKKVRDLQSGFVLHGRDGVANVSEVVENGRETTYNVVVADFSTYFVGKNKLLSRDVTLRAPTRAIVPGLIEE